MLIGFNPVLDSIEGIRGKLIVGVLQQFLACFEGAFPVTGATQIATS